MDLHRPWVGKSASKIHASRLTSTHRPYTLRHKNWASPPVTSPKLPSVSWPTPNKHGQRPWLLSTVSLAQLSGPASWWFWYGHNGRPLRNQGERGSRRDPPCSSLGSTKNSEGAGFFLPLHPHPFFCVLSFCHTCLKTSISLIPLIHSFK